MKNGKAMPKTTSLIADIRDLIRSAQQRAAVSLNAEAVMLYWSVGCRIKVDLMKYHRAGYGEKVQKTVSEKLTAEFGNGWGLRNIQHCVSSADVFSKDQIVSAVRSQIKQGAVAGTNGAVRAMEKRNTLSSDRKTFLIQLCTLGDAAYTRCGFDIL